MNEHITCICGWRAQVNQPLPFLFYPFLAFSATVLGSWVRAKGPLVCPPALLVPIPALNDVWPAKPTRRHASRRFQSVPRVQQMWAEKSQAQDSEVFEGLTFPTITLCRPKSSKSLQHRFTSTACNILDKQSGKSQASRMKGVLLCVTTLNAEPNSDGPALMREARRLQESAMSPCKENTAGFETA